LNPDNDLHEASDMNIYHIFHFNCKRNGTLLACLPDAFSKRYSVANDTPDKALQMITLK